MRAIMICEECGASMVEWTSTVEKPYAYTLSGLKNLFLCGIIVRTCPACGAESPIIPRVGELHRLIVREVLHKSGPLRGDELRFLRRNAGFPAGEFAALIGISASHLSRVEHGKDAPLKGSGDKLARVVVAAVNDEPGLRDVLLSTADRISAQRSKRATRPTFKLVRNRWQPAA